jgi:hypothetical protein
MAEALVTVRGVLITVLVTVDLAMAAADTLVAFARDLLVVQAVDILHLHQYVVITKLKR